MSYFQKLPPKYAAIVIIVASPYYIWAWISIYHHRLPSIWIVAAAFFGWFIVTYFIVTAIFKRMNKNADRR